VEFTAEQERSIWKGWRAGESFRQVGARVGQAAHPMQYFLRVHGGIRPSPAGRSKRHLTRRERGDISRGVAVGLSIRHIADQIGRSHSTVSRELTGNGSRAAYRAVAADDAATARAKRPKLTRLRERPALLIVVKAKLLLDWSPEQISAWLRQTYPDDALMRRRSTVRSTTCAAANWTVACPHTSDPDARCAVRGRRRGQRGDD
jgi:hypothetical protein